MTTTMAMPTEKDLPGVTLHEKSSTDEEEEEEEEWEEEEEDEDPEDDEEEEESTSLWNEVVEGWRQHAFAVLVAVAATALAVACQQPRIGSTSSSVTSINIMENFKKHSHLEGYRRASNISFCESDSANLLLLSLGDGGASSHSHNLTRMDFNVPKTLVPALKLHYYADALEDDEYQRVLSEPLDVSISDPQLDCLDRRVDDSPKTHIKGHTYYFRAPPFDSLYPQIHPSEGGVMLQSTSRPKPAHLTFTGFAAKFVNLSPRPVLLYWDGRRIDDRRLVGEIAPFDALGTATTPGQSFSVSPVYDSSHALDRWVVTADDCLVYYEPDNVWETLNDKQQQLYQMQKLNQEFAKHYLIHSGRSWLSHFPRPFPLHYMWPAAHFGQVHTVQADSGTLYQLTVESVTPRVLSIENFLSGDECDQLIGLALQQGLQGSTVYSGSLAKHQRDLSTRSSMNTWLARSTTELTDRIYRRAAKVLNVDESLLQAPVDDEVAPQYHSMAESLQVVRYKKGEEYTAHHDFVYPPLQHRLQPTRFATLLLYLNDNYQGGQTVFPRAVNSQYHDGITVQPKKGKAVLFYNILPDGNVDDLSQHSSKPIEKGEKVREMSDSFAFFASYIVWRSPLSLVCSVPCQSLDLGASDQLEGL